MIRIIKTEAPAHLINRGTVETNLDIENFNSGKEKKCQFFKVNHLKLLKTRHF